MGTTWTTELANIRTELQEATPGFWADAEFLNWANSGYSDLTRACRVEATSTLTLASGTESYSLPTDFFLARRVEIQAVAGTTTNWIEIIPASLDLRRPGDPLSSVTFTSTPRGYYIFNGKIYFVPVPDQAYSGTLYYYKNSTALTTGSDQFVYPEGTTSDVFDSLILFFVCGMALRKRQDPAYTTYLGDYAAGRQGLINDQAERGTSQPLIVRDDWLSD